MYVKSVKVLSLPTGVVWKLGDDSVCSGVLLVPLLLFKCTRSAIKNPRDFQSTLVINLNGFNQHVLKPRQVIGTVPKLVRTSKLPHHAT
ncbi:hypothetical protein TNCV_486791 [Trichonephila clavipes]|nr:hypothetical protein TNCV_486791 [Trichonephila clavipes]